MALISACTSLPPDSFTRTWSPTLYLRMAAAFYTTTCRERKLYSFKGLGSRATLSFDDGRTENGLHFG